MEMRTVVFSDERVALAVNARFVCVWENKAPEVHFTGAPIGKPPQTCELPVGTGATNVVSVFATPDGDILNAVPGYLDVEGFLDEMRLAWAVQRRTMDSEDQLKPNAAKTFAGLHQAAAKLCGPDVPGQAHAYLAERKWMMTLGTSFQKDFFDSVFGQPR
jgi:hypothetical protein